MRDKLDFRRRRYIEAVAISLSALSGCSFISQDQQAGSTGQAPQTPSPDISNGFGDVDAVVIERSGDGDVLVARGPDGVISRGTDHAAVLESGIGNAPPFSRVYIQADELTPSRQVRVSDVSGITIEGPPHGGTEIRQTGDHQKSLFQLQTVSNLTLRNLTFNGNQSQVIGGASRGVWLRELNGGVTVENVTIKNTLHHALVVDGSGWEIRNCRIKGWNYGGRSEDGISVTGGSSDGRIVGNELYQTGPTDTGAVTAIESQDGASQIRIQGNVCTDGGIECHVHPENFEHGNPASMADIWILNNEINNAKIRCVGQPDMEIERFIIEGNVLKNGQIEIDRFSSIRVRNNDVLDVEDYGTGIRLVNGGQAYVNDNTVSIAPSNSASSSVSVRNVERVQLNGGQIYGNGGSDTGVRTSHDGQPSNKSRTAISDIDVKGHNMRAIELRNETHSRITDCLLENRSDILLNNCQFTRVAGSTMIGRNGVLSINGSDWTHVVNCILEASNQAINLVGENAVTRDNTIRN